MSFEVMAHDYFCDIVGIGDKYVLNIRTAFYCSTWIFIVY